MENSLIRQLLREKINTPDTMGKLRVVSGLVAVDLDRYLLYQIDALTEFLNTLENYNLDDAKKEIIAYFGIG